MDLEVEVLQEEVKNLRMKDNQKMIIELNLVQKIQKLLEIIIYMGH